VPAEDATLDGGLDLDLGAGPASDELPTITLPKQTEPPPVPAESTHALGNDAQMARDDGLDFNLDAVQTRDPDTTPGVLDTRPAPAEATHDGLDFDLGDLGFDGTPAPAAPAASPAAPQADLDLSDFPLDPSPEALAAEGDPLMRKLDLAEEFRQIGDLEGARDLLEEVVSKADGALRQKAQGMLDALG
jgi:pilus assembly protein FimV